jgi:hypothetical protein
MFLNHYFFLLNHTTIVCMSQNAKYRINKVHIFVCLIIITDALSVLLKTDTLKYCASRIPKINF